MENTHDQQTDDLLQEEKEWQKELTHDIEESKEEIKDEFNETKSIIFALIVAVLFALHNFFIGELSNMGYITRMISGVGMLLWALGHYIVKWIIAFQKGEEYWDWQRSIFLDQTTGHILWWVVFAVVANTINVTMGGFMVIYAFNFAMKTNINLGIITSTFGVTPFITATFFYFIFGETLKKAHFLGMIFMIACIVLVAFGVQDQDKAPSSNGTLEETTLISSAFGAIILAILSTVCFSINGVVTRIMKTKFGIKPADLTQAYYVVQSIPMLLGCVLAYSLDNYTFNLKDFLQLVMAGAISGLGKTFLSRAVAIGYAGVVYSLANVEVVLLTILNALFFLQIPNMLEIIAVWLGLLGSCIMSIGPDVYNKVKHWREKEHRS